MAHGPIQIEQQLRGPSYEIDVPTFLPFTSDPDRVRIGLNRDELRQRDGNIAPRAQKDESLVRYNE